MSDDASNTDPTQPARPAPPGWRPVTPGALLDAPSPAEAGLWRLLATRPVTQPVRTSATPAPEQRAAELAPYTGDDDPRPAGLVRLLHLRRDIDALQCEELALTQRLLTTGEVDRLLAGHATTTRDCSPDVWVRTVDDIVAEFAHKADEQAEQRAARRNHLALAPRPDRTGGTLFADLDAPSFAQVSEAIQQRTGVPDGLEPPPTPRLWPATPACSAAPRPPRSSRSLATAWPATPTTAAVPPPAR